MIKVADSINTLPLAVTEADFVQPYSEEIQALRDEIQALKQELEILSDNQLIQLRLINQLKNHKKPANTKEDDARAIKLLEILEVRKSLSFAEARGLLHCDKVLLNRAIKALPKGLVGIKKSGTDKRGRYLFLLPKIS